ncbi:hypothetical protein CAL14_03930 [Bordetella genomosp. 9]|uniref:type VI secretion system Vgr family protein n=1 Tax=Bordetella genomosp. 9 TaxID=1416803 RepID=UPI000A293A72|nr:type VI secretion system tip protein TssI/VgrG [Bordetella genomosp. 9]ARP89543.1 hypothetical protein CAL14_03930 [Bordetella genomosp. 9]
MTDIQTLRDIVVRAGAIPDGVEVVCERLRGRERLGQPYRFEVTFCCRRHTVAAGEIVGKPISVSLKTPHGDRQFNGIVSRFDVVDPGGINGLPREWTRYRVQVRPQLWRLAHSMRCRFFHDKTVLQIAGLLLQDVNWRNECADSYPPMAHCAQYRESDLDFLNRLLQREGIYYYFEHQNGIDTMVLVDGKRPHPFVRGDVSIPFDALRSQGPAPGAIYRWTFSDGMAPAQSRTDTFDFRHVAAGEDGQLIETVPGNNGVKASTIDDYAMRYADVGDLVELDDSAYSKSVQHRQRLALVRLQQREAAAAVGRGRASARAIAPGCRFRLVRHPDSKQNGEYLITGARYSVRAGRGGYDASARGSTAAVFDCRFKVIRASQTYRPGPSAPVPRAGLQTATVVSAGGAPYMADKHGRIKLKFHWEVFNPPGADAGQRAWVRVAHPWSGRQRSAIFLPRAGDEVLVAFLDGDPDHPVVIGSLHNNLNTPPFELPTHGAISAIRTASVANGGKQRNELRFNDKDLQLLFYTDGRSDSYVRQSRFTRVEDSEHLFVGKEQRVQAHDQHLTVLGNQHGTIKGNVWCKAGSNLVQQAGQTVHIKGGVSVLIEADVGVSLKSGSSVVTLTPAGVEIFGTAVQINCPGGNGAAQAPPGPPGEPHEPEEADKGSDFL